MARLVAIASADNRIAAVWLQGSLARGNHDAYSDIDAYLAIDDAAFAAVWGERASLLAQIARPFAWSDATTPGLKAIHALLDGGVRLDLFFEPVSKLEQQKRPAVRVLHDRAGCAPRLVTGWEAPTASIAPVVGIIIKMTRQGATWPLRLLHRGQWSTLAMMELDLINQQLAQLMALQVDPGHFYMNAFSLYRLLNAGQQTELDRLTQRALAAVAARDTGQLKEVHLQVYDALLREGRAACAALGTPYPLNEADERDLRALLEREWCG
ncbi:MAG TPA: aminoglycoside 6-adenylyltransferase [Rhizomicrobium sp.]|nr:aminoglycoside 6-adenylyltransferase [Rhizomicrobium sp.]